MIVRLESQRSIPFSGPASPSSYMHIYTCIHTHIYALHRRYPCARVRASRVNWWRTGGADSRARSPRISIVEFASRINRKTHTYVTYPFARKGEGERGEKRWWSGGGRGRGRKPYPGSLRSTRPQLTLTARYDIRLSTVRTMSQAAVTALAFEIPNLASLSRWRVCTCSFSFFRSAFARPFSIERVARARELSRPP